MRHRKYLNSSPWAWLRSTLDTSTGRSIGPVLGAVEEVAVGVVVGVVVVGVVEAAAAGMMS